MIRRDDDNDHAMNRITETRNARFGNDIGPCFNQEDIESARNYLETIALLCTAFKYRNSAVKCMSARHSLLLKVILERKTSKAGDTALTDAT